MSDEIEAEVRQLWDQGDYDGATTAALRGYGQEVFSFLIARIRAEDRASDVFGLMCEDLWKSMADFQWRCSMRSWVYRLARNAAVRFERTPAERRERRMGLSQVSEIVERERSRTLAYKRTEVKDEFQKLREQLDPEEQTLLILRIDRGMEWNEIARVMAEDAEEDEEALKRASARLRQRFQKLKDRLRQLAIESGLIESAGR